MNVSSHYEIQGELTASVEDLYIIRGEPGYS